jgi:hypothetical protein
VLRKHSWGKTSEREKGGGRFYRKATPGGWREDQALGQAEMVERITTFLSEEFYPGACLEG